MQTELDWIRSALADRRVSIVSERTGLHPNTIARIRDGKNENPTLETLNKLATYLVGEGE
jgi:transcriptional regulator with XRE-family HTH domain